MQADPHVGRLTFIRVYSGTLQSGIYALNSTKGERERIGRLLQMHANHREEIESISAGDICAVIGLKNTFTGDTLCDNRSPVILESINFPEPVIEVAIEPKTRADSDKMGIALAGWPKKTQRSACGPTKRPSQTIIMGMGELHLEVIVDRHAARVPGDGQCRQAAGRLSRDDHPAGARSRAASYARPADVVSSVMSGWSWLRWSRAAASSSRTRSSAARSHGNTSRRLARAFARRWQSGGEAGYPIVDLKATLVDGSYHEVDSSEMAFKIAGSMALKDGVRRGAPVVLEPVMKVEVVDCRRSSLGMSSAI